MFTLLYTKAELDLLLDQELVKIAMK